MPNWCNNKATFISVTDEAKELLKQFKEYLDSAPEEPKFFGWFYPMPEDQAENWYRWNIDNWGTKWNVDKDQDLNFDNEDTICFDTAWSPPIPVIAALAAKFPDLKFTLRYFEGGNFFGGIVEWSNGEVTLDEELEDEEDIENEEFDPEELFELLNEKKKHNIH